MTLYPYACEVDINPIALRKAKIVCNFGLSELNRVNIAMYFSFNSLNYYRNCEKSRWVSIVRINSCCMMS